MARRGADAYAADGACREQRAFEVLALENPGRELFDVAVAVYQRRGCLCAQARDAGIPVRGISDQISVSPNTGSTMRSSRNPVSMSVLRYVDSIR